MEEKSFLEMNDEEILQRIRTLRAEREASLIENTEKRVKKIATKTARQKTARVKDALKDLDDEEALDILSVFLISEEEKE